MRKSIFYKVILLQVIILLFQQKGLAQFEEGKEEILFGLPALNGPAIVASANNTTTYGNSNEDSNRIKNIITLKINENSNVYLASGFSATISFTVDSWETLASSAVQDTKTLTVNYDTTTGAKYTSRAYLIIPKAEKLKITVTNVSITGQSGGWNPLDVLQLENEMRILRYYTLSNNTSYLTPSFASPVNNTDALSVSWTWNSATNNNISQLEWAWVTDEMASFYPNTAKLFESNSIRVDLDYAQNSYKIPLLYDDTGKLYYRVRAALRKNDGSVITGPWSSAQNFTFNGHEPYLNWQSSTSFAENGKFKSVIQYFDGSLRNRQTVTKDNGKENTIVSETIYDLQGRPNIQILPTPTMGNVIKYFKYFNRFIGQDIDTINNTVEDPAKYFDLTPAAVLCNRTIALDSSWGNGKYYSNQNPWLATEQNAKYIPDAKGFAYTETRFMDDATERVRSQGGVGINHQIGSGHETKYYYGKPAQVELDALFATEVGDASHYSKNMVQDANGQMSISYVDMHGRTIATSLAGDPTFGIDSIINATDYPLLSQVNNQLLTSATNIVSGNSIESINGLLVSTPTIYYFRYILDPSILTLYNCTNQQICFDCKYDLEISIKSENCGDTTPKIRRFNNLQIVPANQSCGTSMGFSGEGISNSKNIEFTDTLGVGSWIVRKTLTINDSLFRIRRDSALNAFICKTENDIYDSVYNILASTSGCGSSNINATYCDSCNTNVGNFNKYRAHYLLSIGESTIINTYDSIIHIYYSQDSLECANACGALNVELTTLKSLRNQMLNDMIPFAGQYAIDSIRIDSTGEVFPLTDSRLESKFNIFTNTLAYSPYIKPFYKNPLNENGQNFYYTEGNLIDSIIHGYDESNQSILDTISIPEYSNLFYRTWTNSLIQYHPEYSKLLIAEGELRPSYEWLDKIQGMDIYSDTSGFQNPLSLPTSSTRPDPFFAIAANAADKDIMDNRIRINIDGTTNTSGASIWQMANSAVLCAHVDSSQKPVCTLGLSAASKIGIDPSITDPALKNKVWEQFRALYLGYRNELVLNYINSQPGVLSRIDMDTLLAEGKILVFANMQDMATQTGQEILWQHASTADTGNLNTTLAALSNPFNSNNCLGQKPFWKSRLLQCEELISYLGNETNADSVKVNNIINSILNGMVSVCQHSQNAQQPYGASNVNPAYTGVPQNFEQVINFVLDSAGINTVGIDGYFCNPYTIDFPKPYGLNPQVLTNYSNTIDSCGCRRFTTILEEALLQNADTSSLTSVNQFLLINYNDSISYSLWEGLKKCKDMFKDSCYTLYDSCPKPVISGFTIDSGEGAVVVHYLPNSISSSCEIKVYDQNNDLVTNQNISCSDSLALVYNLDTCRNYSFIIVSSTDSCVSNSDTAFYIGCRKPVITGMYLQKDFYLNYLPQSCYSNCVLNIYDHGSHFIRSITLDCADSIVNTIYEVKENPCELFQFQIVGYSESCGYISSDTAFYNGCCPNPVITGIRYDSLFQVSYQSQPLYTGCTIKIFDATNKEIITQDINCGDTVVNLTDIMLELGPCDPYSFVIESSSEICNHIYSDTAYYPGCCPKPIIKEVIQTQEKDILKLNYQTTQVFDSCIIKIYNDSNILVLEQLLNCDSSSILINYKFDSCKTYSLNIVCHSPHCGEGVSSDTLFYNSCCIKPVLNSVHFDYDNGDMEIGYVPQPNYTSCILNVYDTDNILVVTNIIDCSDSLVVISGLNPCILYRFQLVSTSDACLGMVSDTLLYGGCCPKPEVTKVEYNYKQGKMMVSFMPHSEYKNCKLYVYEANGSVLTVMGINCTDTLVMLDLDPCKNYSFQEFVESTDCGEIFSDSTYYDSCCQRPRISQLQYSNGKVQMTFHSQLNYENCQIIIYSENFTPIDTVAVECGQTFFEYPLDSCLDYHFVIMSHSEYCDTLYSDTAMYRGCDSMVICLQIYKPILLPDPVLIPSLLNCDYNKPCITCAKLDSLTIEFRQKFTNFNNVPYLDSTANDDQLKQNSLWARFLNYRTGFSKTTRDYLEAYHNCHTIVPQPAYAICSYTKPLNDPSDYFVIDTLPCRNIQTQAQFITQMLLQSIKDSLIAQFDSLYKAKCLSAKYQEQFYASYTPKEYHYTLYYYDQAGNLVKTIPPAGVRPNYNSGYLAGVLSARNYGVDYTTSNNEALATHYRYNTLNQVIAQKTPDAGISKFWYDRLGRLVVSQNAKQATLNQYSYTLYDELGRITEVGQSTNSTSMNQTISQDESSLASWIDNISSGSKKQITLTLYDLPYTSIAVSNGGATGLYQKNLRNRVSYSMVFDDENQKNSLSDGTIAGGNSATYYSYDIHGNVDTLLQDYKTGMGSIACSENAGNRFKKMIYSYDLISGKVNDVAYQAGLRDQFYHRYKYDAENRLTDVETSKDKIYWEKEAVYSYYRHGPLSRTLLGQNQVQGLDYAYTIQGWLKGVNSTSVGSTLSNAGDIGQDGLSGANSAAARDAFGFSLNYFNDDYKPINSSVSPFAGIPQGSLPADPVTGKTTGSQLFNGNIGAMAVNIPKLGNPMLYGYQYDQLNRIVRMDAFTGLSNAANTFTPVRTDDYHEEVSYDPNGNIRIYKRNGSTATSNQSMDELEYFYNVDTNGKLLNNKLRHVTDAVTTHTVDLGTQNADNYTYDEIGNLTADSTEGISSIEWTVYGKIKMIIKTNQDTIRYTYDAAGNRISKNLHSPTVNKNTFYIRDASGNVMSIYQEGENTINDGDLTQTELHLYGSSRLGVYNVNVNTECAETYTELTNFIRGNKFFELSNHLGNVLATISDKKLGHNSGADTIDYNFADVVTANDYYPFGMLMPGRKFSSASQYRYGFNGKENDNEVKGEGNQQDYGMRIYDTRLGRFLSVDPITSDYPELTPYQFASNRPLEGVDLDGLEFFSKKDAQGKAVWFFSAPKIATGYDHMQARGIPVAIDPQSNNTTKIYTVTFTKVATNSFVASQSGMQVQGPIKSKALKVGASQKLRNGSSITLTEFSPFENKNTAASTKKNDFYSGLTIKVNYQSANKKVSEVYFLQSINGPFSNTSENRMYDASQGSNPFYFPEYINKGKFQDQPSFLGKPNSKGSFNATLVVYEKDGDTYKAVGKIDYSYDVNYDKKGKGKVTNVKQTFTDISQK